MSRHIEPAIRKMRRDDWPQIRAIYNEGLSSGIAAFVTNAPSWKEWNRSHLEISRLVMTRAEGIIIGGIALIPVPDT